MTCLYPKMLILSLIFITLPEKTHSSFLSLILTMLLNDFFTPSLVFHRQLLRCRSFCAPPSQGRISIPSWRNAFEFFFGFHRCQKLNQKFSKFRCQGFPVFFLAVSYIWRRKSSFSILILNWLGYRRIFTVRLSPKWWKRVRGHRWRGRNRTPWHRTNWTIEGCLFSFRMAEETKIRVRFLTLKIYYKKKYKGGINWSGKKGKKRESGSIKW